MVGNVVTMLLYSKHYLKTLKNIHLLSEMIIAANSDPLEAGTNKFGRQFARD